eukprot:TRINITY_DN1346_c0_g2_i1.p1 TRINITY_DN1346_c0_g2~~TRINITY_DN1346_c0_g2_i1.p1  ORF type:complete len:186 (+),score=64.23 TRINITY_DN1346_c0_g2_i1:281-838(+)
MEDIMRLIVEHKIEYKSEERRIEQGIRQKLINENKVEEYTAQVMSDCRKWKKRKNESRMIILSLLKIDPKLYEASLRNIGDEEELEQRVYKDCVREMAQTEEGKRLQESKKAMKEQYLKEFNLATGRFAVSEHFKARLHLEKFDRKTSLHMLQMIALDNLYEAYALDSLKLDMILEEDEETQIID